LSVVIGGKAAQMTFNKVGRILDASSLSPTAKSVILNGSSGLMFGVGMEVTNAAASIAKGEQIDPASAAINIITSALFGTVEAIKGNYSKGSEGYTKAADIQARLQSGDSAAVKDAVGYINESAQKGMFRTPEITQKQQFWQRPLSLEEVRNLYLEGFEKLNGVAKPANVSLDEMIANDWRITETPTPIPKWPETIEDLFNLPPKTETFYGNPPDLVNDSPGAYTEGAGVKRWQATKICRRGMFCITEPPINSCKKCSGKG
jgi:hypothetical protein